MRIFRSALYVIPLLCLHGTSAHAILIDRGAGLIYDDVLNVTWLQDAQYSITSGYTSTGRLDWSAADAWVTGLKYLDTVRGVAWDDWRLPSTVAGLQGSLVYDTVGALSELSYMYYVNLGYAPNYTHDRFAPSPASGAYNPFVNLDYRAYWSSALSANGGNAWALHFHFGSLELGGIGDGSRVWAVRDGDVGAVSVPEPATLALFGAGLLASLAMRRRRKVGA